MEKPSEKKKEEKKEKRVQSYQQRKSCPKCGVGVHLAEHRDRRSCGRCGYFEKK